MIIDFNVFVHYEESNKDLPCNLLDIILFGYIKVDCLFFDKVIDLFISSKIEPSYLFTALLYQSAMHNYCKTSTLDKLYDDHYKLRKWYDYLNNNLECDSFVRNLMNEAHRKLYII